MMIIILAVFTFVVINRPSGVNPGFTTSLPPDVTPTYSYPTQNKNTSNGSTQLETEVLVGFLILLAILFVWYVGIRIAKEIKGKN